MSLIMAAHSSVVIAFKGSSLDVKLPKLLYEQFGKYRHRAGNNK